MIAVIITSEPSVEERIFKKKRKNEKNRMKTTKLSARNNAQIDISIVESVCYYATFLSLWGTNASTEEEEEEVEAEAEKKVLYTINVYAQ